MAQKAKLGEFAGKNVLVVGDLMLDEFVRGDVARISPEAPVPILEVRGRERMLGGAANAAANVASLGGLVDLVGVIGEDEAGSAFRAAIAAAKMNGHRLVVEA